MALGARGLRALLGFGSEVDSVADGTASLAVSSLVEAGTWVPGRGLRARLAFCMDPSVRTGSEAGSVGVTHSSTETATSSSSGLFFLL